jgi:hypothetical protein
MGKKDKKNPEKKEAKKKRQHEKASKVSRKVHARMYAGSKAHHSATHCLYCSGRESRESSKTWERKTLKPLLQNIRLKRL